jgi:hypothetical protein
MRQLRYVRLGDDGRYVVVETADAAEQFVLFVTTELRDAANGKTPAAVPPPGATTASATTSTITPREIQVRVRGGADPVALAESSQTDLDWLMRFAGPVLDERIRMADEARRARARRSTSEGQTVVFGEAVDQRFALHGIDPYGVHWDSFRRADGQWVITAAWTRDDSEHTAEWAFHLPARNVTAIDDAAADLLSDRPLRAVTPGSAHPDRPTLVAAPPLAPGVVAFPRLGPADADADTDPDTNTATAEAHAPDDVFDQEAPHDPFDDGAFDGTAALSSHSEPVHAPLRLAEAPVEHDPDPAEQATPAQAEVEAPAESKPTAPLPKVKNLGVAPREPAGPDREHGRRKPAHSRPKVPSWDDILLGVRRPTD